jgi:hypothetical protein
VTKEDIADRESTTSHASLELVAEDVKDAVTCMVLQPRLRKHVDSMSGHPQRDGLRFSSGLFECSWVAYDFHRLGFVATAGGWLDVNPLNAWNCRTSANSLSAVLSTDEGRLHLQ